VYSAWKQKTLGLQLGKYYPSQNCISRWLCDFELTGSLSLLLQNERPRRHGLTVADVAYLQLDEITCSKLAVDRQIEKSKISAPARNLQAHTDRPDLLSLNAVFWPTSLRLFQGLRVLAVNATISMVGSFCWGTGILHFLVSFR
jgi:hypothetical protein